MLLCICFTLLVYCMDMWLLKSSFVILHKLEKKTASNSHNYILLVSAESFQCKDCYGQGNVDFHLDEVSCVFYVVNFDTYCFPSVALADLEGASLPGPPLGDGPTYAVTGVGPPPKRRASQSRRVVMMVGLPVWRMKEVQNLTFCISECQILHFCLSPLL